MSYYTDRDKDVLENILSDISNKIGFRIRHENLPYDLSFKINMAISYYKKLKALHSLIVDCEKRLRKIIVFNKDKIIQECESYKKQYKDLEEKYLNIIEAIVEELKRNMQRSLF